jgi:AMP-binding enzyme C-terminal domain
LPRRPEGTVRRDLLRLISTNQVDMIEPLLTSPDEARLVERIVAHRRNLFGAPAIAAALSSHPEVQDTAVLVYPDRLAGTALYAFVETRSAVTEEKLQAFVAAAIGRDNAPQFIQVVPALPRAADGRVRLDILQLVATNQVDSIDPLITSQAERRIVDEILNARRNMRDRFVL